MHLVLRHQLSMVGFLAPPLPPPLHPINFSHPDVVCVLVYILMSTKVIILEVANKYCNFYESKLFQTKHQLLG